MFPPNENRNEGALADVAPERKLERGYPLTRNYYEDSSLRMIFSNFGGILRPRNFWESKTFQGITREIHNSCKNN